MKTPRPASARNATRLLPADTGSKVDITAGVTTSRKRSKPRPSAASGETMAPRAQRRFGAKNSRIRERLVQAGIEVLQAEDASVFTARRVAEQAGLKPQLVHYYFRSIDELVLAIMQRWGVESLRRTLRAVDSDEPLREVWRVTNAERSASLVARIIPLATQNEATHAEMIRQMEQHRILVSEALERKLNRGGTEVKTSGMALLMIIAALARLLVTERALNFTLGHSELTGLIDAWLDAHYSKRDRDSRT
jgi:TetR/AcrR family transcriptional regulator